jgi:hypothetical protein
MPERWAKGGTMKTILKYAAAIALTGALAVAAATPGEARGGRNAAVIGGFVAGAVVGAAAANSYYGPGYYAEPGYAYGPGYGYESDYAYEAPVYVQPGPRYYYGGPRYRSGSDCSASPASSNFGACN